MPVEARVDLVPALLHSPLATTAFAYDPKSILLVEGDPRTSFILVRSGELLVRDFSVESDACETKIEVATARAVISDPGSLSIAQGQARLPIAAFRRTDGGLFGPFVAIWIEVAHEDIALPATQRLPCHPNTSGGVGARISEGITRSGCCQGDFITKASIGKAPRPERHHVPLIRLSPDAPQAVATITSHRGLMKHTLLGDDGNVVQLVSAHLREMKRVSLAVVLDIACPRIAAGIKTEVGKVAMQLLVTRFSTSCERCLRRDLVSLKNALLGRGVRFAGLAAGFLGLRRLWCLRDDSKCSEAGQQREPRPCA